MSPGDLDQADEYRERAREAVWLARLEALARGGPVVEAPARAPLALLVRATA